MKIKLKPTKHSANVLSQLCKLIPTGVTKKLAEEYGVDVKARTYSPWSHVVTMLFAQLVHAVSLNDVCDGLRHHASKLFACRGATPPAKNTLSHANKTRNSDMMEALFWKTLNHLQNSTPHFAMRGKYSKFPRRFKSNIYAIDSSTIPLIVSCIDWAKHRRRKAAAKLHLSLKLNSFLPQVAIIEEASHHDNMRAISLCAPLQAGEIAVFDKAYIDFKHLFALDEREVYWVTRAKDNMNYRVRRRNKKKRQGNILRDDQIQLTGTKSKKQYPQTLRRIEAEVEVDGKKVVMAFITNNFKWAAQSVCDLYQSRWGIEVFFKQLKQTLQLCDFLGTSKHAIRWQLWSALLLYVLLRYQAYLNSWHHSFSRLVTLIRGVVWDRFDLYELLQFYGTAGGKYRMCATAETAYLPGFPLNNYGTASYLINPNELKFS